MVCLFRGQQLCMDVNGSVFITSSAILTVNESSVPLTQTPSPSCEQELWVPMGSPTVNEDGSTTYTVEQLEIMNTCNLSMLDESDMNIDISPEYMQTDVAMKETIDADSPTDTDSIQPVSMEIYDQIGGANDEPYVIHPEQPIFNMTRAHFQRNIA